MTTNVTHASKHWLTGGPKLLQLGAIAYGAGMSIHGVDHALRGFAGDDRYASWSAGLQVFMGGLTIAFSAVAVWTAAKRLRRAPLIGIVVGFGSGITFLVVHMLPAWADFTDSFVGAHPDAHVTQYSWITATIGIAASFVYGLTAVAAQFPVRSDRHGA